MSKSGETAITPSKVSTQLENIMNLPVKPIHGIVRDAPTKMLRGYLETFTFYKEGVQVAKAFTFASLANVLDVPMSTLDGKYARSGLGKLRVNIPSRAGRPMRGFPIERLDEVIAVLETPGAVVKVDHPAEVEAMSAPGLYPLVVTTHEGKDYYTVQSLAEHFAMTPTTIRAKLKKSGMNVFAKNLGSSLQGGRPKTGWPVSCRGKLKLAIIDGYVFRDRLENTLLPPEAVRHAERVMDSQPHIGGKNDPGAAPRGYVTPSGEVDEMLDFPPELRELLSQPVSGVNSAPGGHYGEPHHREPQLERGASAHYDAPKPMDIPKMSDEDRAASDALDAEMERMMALRARKSRPEDFYLKPHEFEPLYAQRRGYIVDNTLEQTPLANIEAAVADIARMAHDSKYEPYMWDERGIKEEAKLWWDDWMMGRIMREGKIPHVMKALEAELKVGEKPRAVDLFAANLAFRDGIKPLRSEWQEFARNMKSHFGMVREFKAAIVDAQMPEEHPSVLAARPRFDAVVKATLDALPFGT